MGFWLGSGRSLIVNFYMFAGEHVLSVDRPFDFDGIVYMRTRVMLINCHLCVFVVYIAAPYEPENPFCGPQTSKLN